MDIQRGDQVYYRGEVWTVFVAYVGSRLPAQVELRRRGQHEELHQVIALLKDVQRVEQVR